MLPDFPKEKAKLMEHLREMMQMQMMMGGGFAGKLPKTIIFEGDSSIINRDDGTSSETKMKQVSSVVSISKEDLDRYGPTDVQDKLLQAAQDMAQQQSKLIFETMDEEISKIGNTVNGNGRPFSIEMFFEALEKMHIDFNPVTGEPYMPTWVAGPELAKKIAEELKKLDEVDECKVRLANIIKKKKDEWDVRESNRKLVG